MRIALKTLSLLKFFSIITYIEECILLKFISKSLLYILSLKSIINQDLSENSESFNKYVLFKKYLKNIYIYIYI